MEENEIAVTLEKIVEITGKSSLKEIEMIPLKCANCGHKDILRKFVREYVIKYTFLSGNVSKSPISSPIKLKEGIFEKFFFCPKCESSLIVCSKDELVVRGI